MRSHLAARLSALSAALCLATLLLWARSYYAEDHLGRVRRQLVGQQVIEHRWGLASHRGRMALIITADLEMPQAMYSQGIAERSAPTDRFGWHADTTSDLAWAYAEDGKGGHSDLSWRLTLNAPFPARMLKRNLGDSLRCRRPGSRQREQLLRVLTHNLLLARPRRARVETEPHVGSLSCGSSMNPWAETVCAPA